MSLTSYWGQQRMSLTSYPGQWQKTISQNRPHVQLKEPHHPQILPWFWSWFDYILQFYLLSKIFISCQWISHIYGISHSLHQWEFNLDGTSCCATQGGTSESFIQMYINLQGLRSLNVIIIRWFSYNSKFCSVFFVFV